MRCSWWPAGAGWGAAGPGGGAGGSLVSRYAGAVQTEDLFGDTAAGTSTKVQEEIKGPLNILLVGIDPREPETPPLADSIMVVHIPEGLKSAYIFSLPRDTYVEMPAFEKAGLGPQRGKINGAMSMGSRVPGERLPSATQGFELLSKTVSKLTGIERFDAGALVNLDGFKKVVDAMGGVDLYVDERTVSEHRAPDGSGRPHRPRYKGDPHPYRGPQKTYEVGDHHLEGWEALDFVRQRYGLKGTDYGRQRHQQQFLKAMAKQATSADVITNPVKLDKVIRAGGNSLTFNGRGRSVVDFAFALKGLGGEDITTIKLSGGGAYSDGGRYLGEQLAPGTEDLFAAIRDDTIDSFLLNNPQFINESH